MVMTIIINIIQDTQENRDNLFLRMWQHAWAAHQITIKAEEHPIQVTLYICIRM